MIEKLLPCTRRVLVECRCSAMEGRVESAVEQLTKRASDTTSSVPLMDQVALLMLKAEILFLDSKEQDSLKVFENEIEGKLGQVASEVALIVSYNRNVVTRAVLDRESVAEWYHLYDWQRLEGTELQDSEALLYAYEAAADDKHYEALPSLYSEVRRSYYQGCWHAEWRAARRLGEELVALGQFADAAYCAVIAQDTSLGKGIAQGLLEARNADKVEQAVSRLLLSANLRRHAGVAGVIIGEVADGIPEQKVADVFEWLLHRCKLEEDRVFGLSTSEKCWEAIKNLAPQMNEEQATEVVKVATSHSLWKKRSTKRRSLINAASACVALMPSEELRQLALNSLVVATELRADMDFSNVVNLLCIIADRADEQLKEEMVSVLYPPGTRVENRLLVMVAPKFGKTLKYDLEATVDGVVKNIRLQVQRLKVDEEPRAVWGTYGNIAQQTGDEKVVVQMVGDLVMEGLTVLGQNRKSLSGDAVKTVASAIVDMVTDPDNIPCNKVGLIAGLGELGDCLKDQLLDEVFGRLAPVASPSFRDSSVAMTDAQLNDPLNPYRWNLGSAAEVRGAALWVLAKIIGSRGERYLKQLDSLVCGAMTDYDPRVRRHGFLATREMPRLSEASLIALLLGTRDPDPKAASSAYCAISTKRDWQLGDQHWQLVLYSLRMSLRCPTARVRWAAASAIRNLSGRPASPEVAAKLDELRGLCAQDLCFSVRMAITHENSRAPEE